MLRVLSSICWEAEEKAGWMRLSIMLFGIISNLLLFDRQYQPYKENQLLFLEWKRRTGRKTCFGEALDCKYSYKAGRCGKEDFCASCPIRMKMRETFAQKGRFSNVEITMSIFSRTQSKGLYNIMLSDHSWNWVKKTSFYWSYMISVRRRFWRSPYSRQAEVCLCIQ